MKIKTYILLTISICLFHSCITNRHIDELLSDKTKLYPISNNQKWGYANEEGVIIIPYKYDSVSFFSSGLAVAEIEGKFGFLKSNGDWHIKPIYEHATNFDYNCASVIDHGIQKNINRKNKKCKKITFLQGGCIPPTHRAKKEDHSIFKNGKNAIINDKYFKDSITNKVEIDKDTTLFVFDEIIEFSLWKILIKKGGKYGLYDVNGMKDISVYGKEYEVYEIDRGYGLDSIIFQFDELKIEYQTFAGLKDRYEVRKTPFRIGNLWGIITNHGQIILHPKYLDVEIYNWNLAKVEFEKNKFGYVDIYKRKEYFKRTTIRNNR